MTRVTLATVNVNDQHLRKQIEGNAYQEDAEPEADALVRESYAHSFELASRPVLYAAYFLGQVPKKSS